MTRAPHRRPLRILPPALPTALIGPAAGAAVLGAGSVVALAAVAASAGPSGPNGQIVRDAAVGSGQMAPQIPAGAAVTSVPAPDRSAVPTAAATRAVQRHSGILAGWPPRFES